MPTQAAAPQASPTPPWTLGRGTSLRALPTTPLTGMATSLGRRGLVWQLSSGQDSRE